jgi:hypothetical protein
VRTCLNNPKLDNLPLAKPDVDFEEITGMQLDFGDCQDEALFNVFLPSSSLKNFDGSYDNEAAPVYFCLELNIISPYEEA